MVDVTSPLPLLFLPKSKRKKKSRRYISCILSIEESQSLEFMLDELTLSDTILDDEFAEFMHKMNVVSKEKKKT